MAESRVKVGVRIRPLLSKEKGQNVTFNTYDNKSVSFKGQTYTYDHVFGMELSQYELYTQTAAPMLKSFMEGYNCTIMAYGQTGSGKTFSMGTADISHQDPENQGLISRFVTDLFVNLNNAKDEGELISYQVKASFLEIYGEDVFDLLPSESSNRNGGSRVALNVREDEGGKIFVQGQNEFSVGNAVSTLELLNSGARHRITASTAMNSESSRSHSVFTLQLEQRVRSAGGEAPQSGAAVDDEVQVLCAKLTFVDLAGSERIKRTGAEGQRMKEGIQINSGLFNLGQVINSLADEQKLKSGVAKANHVPYRNSKLTHLLKDALGGNSQTLFLACVSPAESNESETQSTLQYAKQARNIQNKPVQNVDKIQRELQRLRLAVKMWTMKAVTSIFGNSISAPNTRADTDAGSIAALEKEATALLSRPEVSEFVAAMNGSISEKTSITMPKTNRSVRLSVGTALSPSPMKSRAGMYSPVRPIRSHALNGLNKDAFDVYSPPCNFPGVNGAYMGNAGRESILAAFPSLASAASQIPGAEPEETERLLARMMDMVHKEKEQYLAAAQTGDSEATEQDEAVDAVVAEDAETVENTAPSEDIVEMDKTIQEKEEILLKLQETVKGYAVMKSEFEKLLGAINCLEDEKRDLEGELERAKKLADAGNNTAAGAGNAAALERIKERFAKVTNELKQMRDEKKGKESAFRLMQRENKQCDTLQRELRKLKENRVLMAKQQKSQALQMQRLKKDQVQKAIQFKKSDVRKQQMVNTLKSELLKKERVLGHKDREIARIGMKLKACEEHITQLLKLQNRARNAPAGKTAASSGIPAKAGTAAAGASRKGGLSTGEAEHLQSSKAMLEHMLIDRLDRHISRILYDQKACQLAELNREMEQDAAELDAFLQQKKALVADMRCRGILSAAQEGAEVSPEDATEGQDEDEVDLAQLCGSENNGLLEEEKYQVSQLKTSIEMCENSLERLTKEVDICNADIDELSLRIEANQSKGAAGGKANPDSAWDEMGREIVAGLSVAQSHALLWDLMDEKLKTLEQLRIAHSALSKSQADLDQQVDKTQELNQWVAALRGELKTRLERAEKLRVDDMWALMQASTHPSNGNSSEGDSKSVAREEAASRIAIQRAHELEKELEIALTSEDELKEQLGERAVLIRELQKRVSELALRAEYSESESTWADVGGMITEGDHSEELRQITATTGRDTRSSLQPGPDSYMDKLFGIWEELGLPEEERSEALEYVQKSRTMAKERAVLDAETHLAGIKKEVEISTERLQMLCAALGTQPSHYVTEIVTEGRAVPPLLLPLLQSIRNGCQRAECDIEQKFSSLSSVKDRLTEVMSEMWLEIQDLPAALRPLAKLVLSALSDEPSSSVAAVAHVAEQLTAMKSSLVNIPTWEAEIRKLNLLRVQLTSKLVAARDASLKLLAELQLIEPKAELTLLMKSAAALSTKTRDSGLDDQLSSQAVSAAVQILITNSASNPPGSEKLLNALQRVQLVLESVKVNRSTVAQLTARYIHTYISTFPEESDVLLPSGATADAAADAVLIEKKEFLQRALENQVWSTAALTDTFTVACALPTRSAALNKRLRAEVAAAIVEISAATSTEQCEDYIAAHLAAIKYAQSPATAQLVSGMEEPVEELEGMAMFVEETWVQDRVRAVTQGWEAKRVSSSMNENGALLEELGRLRGLCEAQRELIKADAALRRHVAEMDDFEEKSKQDRAKALSGNSRLLVEEEKFRKSGKKKYEQLSERMLQLFGRLNSLSAGLAVPHIDVRPSLEGLSTKGRGLLKGRFKERIELMHLQLSTGPAAAAAEPSPTSGIPVPATTAGSRHAPKKTTAHPSPFPSAIPNVFDFATHASDSNVAKSSSHDTGADKDRGIALSGRASSESLLGGDKENRRVH